MTFPINQIQFGQQTAQKVQPVLPRIAEQAFGASQPLGMDLNISKPGLNPFGNLRPVVQNSKLANKLDFDA